MSQPPSPPDAPLVPPEEDRGFFAKFTQNHVAVLPDFYGLTTSFREDRLKPSDIVLAREGPLVKYVHGNLGEGTWTYFGGHDPEDPEHQIGDPQTDLALHANSPGYRLILNNVLFPAAKKQKLKVLPIAGADPESHRSEMIKVRRCCSCCSCSAVAAALAVTAAQLLQQLPTHTTQCL